MNLQNMRANIGVNIDDNGGRVCQLAAIAKITSDQALSASDKGRVI